MLGRIARRILPLIAALPCIATAQPVRQDESPWRLGAAFGYGVRSNPLVQSEDIPILVDLDVAWFGDRWFFDNGDAGLTFADNSVRTLSLVGRFNSDRVFFGRTNTKFFTTNALGIVLPEPASFRPPDRDYAVELGVELLTDGAWGDLQATFFRDVSGKHGGYELRADYSYGWRRRRLSFEPSVGVSYKSAKLDNYYWGVTADEAGEVVLPYMAGAGLNWELRLAGGYQINRRWAMSVVLDYERLNGEIAASPIVRERNVRGWFVGMSWRF